MKLVALAASFTLFGEARAAIVYFPGENIPLPNTYAGLSVDLETGSSSTSLNGLVGGDANFFLGGARVSNDADAGAITASWQPVRTGTGNTAAIRRLDVGTTIDVSTASYSTGFGASGQINSHMVGGPSGFSDGVPGYLGFSLMLPSPSPAPPCSAALACSCSCAVAAIEERTSVGGALSASPSLSTRAPADPAWRDAAPRAVLVS